MTKVLTQLRLKHAVARMSYLVFVALVSLLTSFLAHHIGAVDVAVLTSVLAVILLMLAALSAVPVLWFYASAKHLR